MIVIECNNDEFLIKSFGFSRKEISHQRCKGEVIKKVGKLSAAIGIIDEDPQSIQPGDLKKYKVIRAQGDLKLFTGRNDKSKKIILISPYLEHWIINRTKSNKINVKYYNLPVNPKKLHDIPHLERNKGFQKLLRELIESDVEFKCLKNWIKEALE